MSDNKFIAKLKGDPTPNSVVEIKNDKLVAPFKSSSLGYIQDKDSSVVVAKGAQSWIINQNELMPVAEDFSGTEKDIISTSRVEGAGLWVNATYTFPYTGDETNPVSAIIAPNAKWVLTLCGDTLITHSGNTLSLTLLVKIGATHLTTKQFKVSECASQFSKSLCIDFSESEKEVIKAHGGAPLTVQVLCDDEKASATLYNGMSHLSLLQRKIDASLVSTDNVLLPEFIENLSQGFIIPDDYFSRYEFLEKVEDGATAMPEFTRNGDTMSFSGWAKPAEEVYTKAEIDNKVVAINAEIDANAEAIQKTRDDYMSADADIMTIINNHAEELTNLRGNQASLGDQVAGIEQKIPESASGSNPLVTKQQLLDEEMDIRDDVNEMVGELQTQITAQATAIATLDSEKLDKNQGDINAGKYLVVGNDGNIELTASGGGGSGGISSVAHDETLTGAGTDASPLGVAKNLSVEELTVGTDEGTLNLSITAGVATIATNNGLDIVSQTKFDKAPTTDDNTTWADALDTSLVRKAQVASAMAGFEALPDQSGNSGKFLTTNGTTASWSDKPIVNNASAKGGIAIGLYSSASQASSVSIGSSAGSSYGSNLYSVAVGANAQAHSLHSTAIGGDAIVKNSYAVQIGYGTNTEHGTVCFGNKNGNFKIMSADGTIPADRIGNLDFGTMD